jgi:4-coumarate--CoA ligase
VVGAGGVFSCANPGLKGDEAVQHYRKSGTKFVIAGEEILPLVLDAASKADVLPSHIYSFAKRPASAPRDGRYWTDLVDQKEEDWIRFDNEKRSRGTVAALFPTSGTTGPPKQAMISHYNLVASGALLDDTHVKPFQVRP